MSILDDVHLDRTGQHGVRPPRRRGPLAVLAVVVIAIAGIGVYFWLNRGPGPQELQSAPTAASETAPPPAEVDEPMPTNLPPLSELDPTVRSLVGELSSHPLVTRWLTGNGLAQQMAAIAHQVGNGRLPTRLLGAFRPSGSFSVVERDGVTVIDPASHERYNAMADAVASLDPAFTARVYNTLKPRLEEAYQELGEGGSLDAATSRAIGQLLSTPEVNSPAQVEERGGIYAFTDPKLEALTPAQKLLIRAGPENAARIKARIREIAQALNLSPDPPATQS
jgi:Protein of unknown function (DUF3014)